MNRECLKDTGWFFSIMMRELANNDHKVGWQEDHPVELLERVNEELSEVMELFPTPQINSITAHYNNPDPESIDDIISECADIANMAMMVAAQCRKLKEASDE